MKQMTVGKGSNAYDHGQALQHNFKLDEAPADRNHKPVDQSSLQIQPIVLVPDNAIEQNNVDDSQTQGQEQN